MDITFTDFETWAAAEAAEIATPVEPQNPIRGWGPDCGMCGSARCGGTCQD